MKFEFNLKEKKASFDADVEGLVQKSLEHKEKNPSRKTRYQIKQEEKRKNSELKHKQSVQWMIILLALVVIFAVIGIVASIYGV